MSRVTQQDAFAAFRMLRTVDAGRLRGDSLVRYPRPIPTGALDEPAAAVLRANLTRPPGTLPSADGIVFVASCDGTPVAWLTRDTRVTTPAAQLSDYQRRQQARAVEALTDLPRRTIAVLAGLADRADGRPDGGSGSPGEDAGPHLLVADPATPTLTHWARISAEEATSLAHLRAVTGAADHPLIVDALGYGQYGTQAAVLDLAALCTLERIARSTDLPVRVVGDWLHAEGGSTSPNLPVDPLATQFQASLAGVYPGKEAFAAAERDARGWTTALQQAGIPDVLFDLRGFTQLVFADDAYAVAMSDGRIAVFYRPTARRSDRRIAVSGRAGAEAAR